MQAWRPQRASSEAPQFQESLRKALGVDHYWLWDHARISIEETLLGADLERLDLVYPANASGVRVALTESTQGLPPLRIAFYLDEEADDGMLVYLEVDRRSGSAPRGQEG